MYFTLPQFLASIDLDQLFEHKTTKNVKLQVFNLVEFHHLPSTWYHKKNDIFWLKGTVINSEILSTVK